MSTLAACYMASVGVFTKNIYLDFIEKKPDTKKRLAVSRWAIVVCGIVALYFSISFQQILALAYLAWDVIFVTLFWPLIIPPFWKGVSGKAVWSSITVGIVVYIATTIYGVPISTEGGLLITLFTIPVFFSVVISGLVMFIVSFISPPNAATLEAHRIEITPNKDELEYTDSPNENVSL